MAAMIEKNVHTWIEEQATVDALQSKISNTLQLQTLIKKI